MDEPVRAVSDDVEQLLATNQRRIRAFAYAITRDFAIADDVCQEVAVIVTERWASVPRDQRQIGWILTVARHKALESLRRWKPARQQLAPEAIEHLEAVFRDPPAADLRAGALSACVDRLEADARVVVQSRYWEDLSCEDIAARIGRSVKSVYGILCRARQALAECIERVGAGRSP